MTTEPATDLSTIVGTERRQHLSFSQLSVYQQCGTKYALSYVERAPREPQGAFLGGRSLHEAIQRAEQEEWWLDDDAFLASDGAAIAEFHRLFDLAVMESGPALSDLPWRERKAALDRLEGDERAEAIASALPAIRWGGRGGGENYAWWHAQGEFMLRRYRDTRQAMEEGGWAPVEGGVEMKVLAELPGVSVPVVGYLDKFLMRELDRETGEVGDPAILDYKTGKIGNADPMQFATYSRLLRLSRGIETTVGIAIFLRAADAERRVQRVDFADLLPHVDELYAGLVRGIDAELFMPNPNAYCPGCSVRASCWYWNGTARGKEEA